MSVVNYPAKSGVLNGSGSGATTYLGAVANNTTLSSKADTTQKELTAWTDHYATEDLTAIAPEIWNGYVEEFDSSTFQEKNLGTTMQIMMSVEYPIGSTPQMFTWSGSATGSIAAGAYATADMKTLSTKIPKNAKFRLRYWYHNDGGIFYQRGSISFGYGGPLDTMESGTTVAEKVTTNATITRQVRDDNKGYNFFGATAILAQTSNPSVLILGNSIAGGTGDTPDETGDLGFIARSIGGVYGYINAGVGGDRAGYIVASGSYREHLGDYVTHVALVLGTNEMVAALLTATVMADMQTIIDRYYNKGKQVAISNLPPYASSTNGFYNAAAQTTNATYKPAIDRLNAHINGGNMFKRIVGVINLTDVVQSTFNASSTPTAKSGIWRADGSIRTTADAAITSGSDVVSSATAAFGASDTKLEAYVGGVGQVVLTTLTATTASMTDVTSGLPVLAGSTLSSQSLVIGALPHTPDGIHPNRRACILARAMGVVREGLGI